MSLDYLMEELTYYHSLARRKEMETQYHHITSSTFRAFSQINKERALIWHKGDLNSWSESDWFTALAGEVGELGNIIKKMNRVRDGLTAVQPKPEELRQMAADELADVFTYLDLLATRMGIELLPAIVAKFNKISDRENMPIKIELIHK